MKTLSFILSTLVLHGMAFADIQWEKKELEFFPSPTDTSVTAEFHFTNTGAKPVTIASVKPACGCTTAVLDKTTYGPGEHGRITSVFTFGQRTGLQNKQIRVSIKGGETDTILSIITHLPEIMKVSPVVVFWRTGDAPQPKTIELTVGREEPVRVTGVKSSDPSVKVALETVQEGKSYKLVVTPGQTAMPVSSLLTIDTEVAPNVHQLFSAYAHVKLAESSRPKITVFKDGKPVPAPAGDGGTAQ